MLTRFIPSKRRIGFVSIQLFLEVHGTPILCSLFFCHIDHFVFGQAAGASAVLLTTEERMDA